MNPWVSAGIVIQGKGPISAKVNIPFTVPCWHSYETFLAIVPFGNGMAQTIGTHSPLIIVYQVQCFPR